MEGRVEPQIHLLVFYSLQYLHVRRTEEEETALLAEAHSPLDGKRRAQTRVDRRSSGRTEAATWTGIGRLHPRICWTRGRTTQVNYSRWLAGCHRSRSR